MNRLLIVLLCGAPLLWVVACLYTDPVIWAIGSVFALPFIWVAYRYIITMKFIRKNKRTLNMLDQEIKKGTFDDDN